MSWWAKLEDPLTGDALDVESHSDGGTYAAGGTTEAELNVTCNYGGHFRTAWPEDIEGAGVLVRMLDGKTGEEAYPLLAKAVKKLGTDRGNDYWESTPGNAGYALAIMAGWSAQHPDGVWRIS